MKTRKVLVLAILLVASGRVAVAQPSVDTFTSAAACPACTPGPVSQLHLPYSGVEAWSTKLFNPENNAIIPVTLMADGTVADHEKLRHKDYEAMIAKYGKLAPSLGARLASMADIDKIDVLGRVATFPSPKGIDSQLGQFGVKHIAVPLCSQWHGTTTFPF